MLKRQNPNPHLIMPGVKKAKLYPNVNVAPGVAPCQVQQYVAPLVLPAPVIEFILPNGNAANYVQVGLWDNAWRVNGTFHNNEQEIDNFIGRDSRSFRIRVTDQDAVARAAATVTVQWWTRRVDHLNNHVTEDDDHPGTADLTLERELLNPSYISKRIMLVTDGDDAAQGTHTGLNGGNVVAQGQADHRLRRITVSARYELDGSVRASYAHQNAAHMSPVETDATVFNRNPDERRRIVAHLVKVLDAAAQAGGQCTTTDIELGRYEDFILSIYARAGIFVQMDRVDLDPPQACLGWAGRVDQGEDPAVGVAIQERSQNPIQIVPHPTQTALINAANVQPGEIYLFFVANMYDLVIGVNAGGEAFYTSQTTHPGNPNNALADLNAQLRAHTLAALLFQAAQAQQMNNRKTRLEDILADASRAAGDPQHGDDMLQQAMAFWGSVEGERTDMGNPLWLRTLLGQLQQNAQANLYQAPAFTGRMTAARGSAFIVRQQHLGSDLAPAHELTHITTDLNNAADGHFDLENPNVFPNNNTVGYDLPGHIDGKNLMHRYALDAGNPQGVNLPKRLWDHQVMNVHRNMQIPAQITAILGNAVFIQPY